GSRTSSWCCLESFGGVDVVTCGQVRALDECGVVTSQESLGTFVTVQLFEQLRPVLPTDQHGMARCAVVRRPDKGGEGSGTGVGEHPAHHVGADVGQVDQMDQHCIGV